MTADRKPRSRFPGADQDEAPEQRINASSERSPAPDPVDESNKDSFPASDPSSWWAGIDVPDQEGPPD